MALERRRKDNKGSNSKAKAAVQPKPEEGGKQSPNPDQDHLDEGVDDHWLQPKVLLKPDNQLDLTEEELSTEFTRILNSNNPHAAQNFARFSYKERTYKVTKDVDQLYMHFSMDGGFLLYKGTDEAKRQLAGEGVNTEGQAGEGKEGGAGEGGEEQAPAPIPVESMVAAPKKETLRNQFNFSERASQTFNNPHRDRETSTEPPPRATFSDTATQWAIYDAYVADLERQKQSKDKANKGSKSQKDEDKKKKLASVETVQDDVVHSGAMVKASKIVERMVNQNTYDDIAQDFKYWEDQSDEFRDTEGTLLPLWKFQFEKAKKKAVTSLCFNPQYKDLFAVAYGSYDFLKQGSGLVCCFTFKNPSFPEYVFQADSGVMCLDFHPQHPALLACGLYDGSVAIFDVQSKNSRPIFQSTTKSGKHTDPVWQVSWQDDDLDKNLNFFSVSSDGRVTSWTLVKNELHHTDVIELRLADDPKRTEGNPQETQLFGLGCGISFDVNKTHDHLFLVGTEEGKIHKCSKAYNSQYLATYDAHHMSVYTVKWNLFHPRVFASCSADWTVKIWEHNHPNPIFSYDVKTSVGDIAWAPYSAFVFATVAAEKVRVYDLEKSRHDPICVQAVVRKNKLTHVSFNPHYPIILVGDDRGNVTSLKLSPNLRKSLQEMITKQLTQEKFRENEIAKMDSMLSSLDKGDKKSES